jgi:hypothetical protein
MAAELAAQSFGPAERAILRYEDYVADPVGAIGKVARWAGMSAAQPAFLQDRSRPRASVHMVGGNRLRFEREVVALKPDTEWMQNMSAVSAAVVTVATLPLLLRYGYSPHPFGRQRGKPRTHGHGGYGVSP